MAEIAGLSLATSAVQFIDFGCKILSKTYQVYKSSNGLSTQHEALSTVAARLRNMSTRLAEALTKEQGLPKDTIAKMEMQTICEDCRKVADELASILTTSPSHTKLRQALKLHWNEERINSLADRLAEYRQQLILCILMLLR